MSSPHNGPVREHRWPVSCRQPNWYSNWSRNGAAPERHRGLPGSAVGPLRRAFFQEGADTLTSVFQIEQIDEAFALGGQQAVQRLAAGAMDQLLAGLDRLRALATHLGRQAQRGDQCLILFDHFLDQTDALGLDPVDTFTAE